MQRYVSISTHKIKMLHKLALLPFPFKFGVWEVERFSQSLGNFSLIHLNVSYMTNFWSHALRVENGVRSEEILSRIYRSRRHSRHDLEFL